MLLEVGIIAAGVPVGWALRKRRVLVRLTDAVMTWSIRCLLLFLGLGLGGNELLMSQIESLGTRGAIIALAAVLGSLAAARLLEPFLHLPAAPLGPPEREVSHTAPAARLSREPAASLSGADFRNTERA